MTLTADTLTINPAEGEQTVVAADKAGNTTSLTITVNDGHTWGDWTSNEDDTHTRTCTVEGCNKSETEHCSGGKADCHTKAVCDLCGDSYGEFDAANHTGGTEVRDQKAATCTTKGYTGDTYCKGCGVKLTSGKEIPVAGHTWSKWTTKTKATVFKAEVQQRSCSVCKETETKTVGKKLTPTITVNARKIWLQKGQKTSAFKVTGLANGDSVKSYKSSNTKIFTVTNKGVIKAGKKVGKAKLIITLKSGLKKVIPIKVQNRRVRTWHIYNLPTKVTLKKGATYNLKPVISLITSTHGFTYGSSNKKVATVNKNGMITAKKKGTATITVKSRKITEKVKITVK